MKLNKYFMMDNEKKILCTTIPRLSVGSKERRLEKRRRRVAFYDLNEMQSAETAKFYSSMPWKNARRAYISQHPVCELSLLDNQVKPAQHVHHIIKWFEQDTEDIKWTLMLDPDNLLALDNRIHQYIHYCPNKLTQAQRDYIAKRKKELIEKYQQQCIPIKNPSDSNLL